MHAAAPHPDPYAAPLFPPADPDPYSAMLPPPADPHSTGALVPAALLLSTHEMFHRMMAAPWAKRPPAHAVATSCQ